MPAIPCTTPEPVSDIRAQLAALADPAHPKDAVFIARGNEDALPGPFPYALQVHRPEGTLFTTDPAKAAAFAAGADDDGLAAILDLPAPKSAVAAATAELTFSRSLQARDAAGRVVTEAVIAPAWRAEAVTRLRPHVPRGGSLVELCPKEMQTRRLVLRERERAGR